MDAHIRRITIAASVALEDAGEATRCLEIMDSVRASAPPGMRMRAVFFTHGSKFDSMVRESGYELMSVEPRLPGEGSLGDLKPTSFNFVGSRALAADMIRGELAALRALQPDYVLHGFWPFASIARRMVTPEIPGIRFLPLPLSPEAFSAHLLTDVPDQIVPLTLLSATTRRRIARAIPGPLLMRMPIYRQKNLARAAADCGWDGEKLANLFDMLEADLTLVNDFSGFYEGMRLPRNFVITGAVYAGPRSGETVDPAIEWVFRRNRPDQVNLFCSLGSSATREYLIEAARAIAALPQDRFRAVILSPRAVCPVKEILAIVGRMENIHVTDRFVPATLVSALADITVSHGGQGTVQTALISGTPIVGFAMQPEQQINLDHAALRGAAIRIPKFRWNRRSVGDAILTVASEPSYRENAARLGRMMVLEDGRKKSAEAVWAYILGRRT